MAKVLGQSDPTIRDRLDDIIGKLDSSEGSSEQRRCAIVDSMPIV